MTPILAIPSTDHCNMAMTFDLRDNEDVGAIVEIPMYGPDHHAGMDCWCQPFMDNGIIVHANTQH